VTVAHRRSRSSRRGLSSRSIVTTYRSHGSTSAHPSAWPPTSFSVPSATAGQHDEWIILSGDLDGSTSLTRPITVHVWPSGPQYVAETDDFSVIAYGDTSRQAVEELRGEIVSHLRWLDECGEMLAPRLRQERYRLRRIIMHENG
jgi:hypothetical protein